MAIYLKETRMRFFSEKFRNAFWFGFKVTFNIFASVLFSLKMSESPMDIYGPPCSLEQKNVKSNWR